MNPSAYTSTNFRHIYVKKYMKSEAKTQLRSIYSNYKPQHPIRFILLLLSISFPYFVSQSFVSLAVQ